MRFESTDKENALCAVQLWRQHWDFQLYKALDVQYRVGLESINKTLPEVGAGGASSAGSIGLARGSRLVLLISCLAAFIEASR